MFFVGTALAIAGVGLSLWEGISSAGDEREQAERSAESIKKEMELLRKQKDELSYMYRLKGENIRDKYSNQATTLLDRVQSNLLKTEEAKRESAARTGLQYSGTIERRADIEASIPRRTGVRQQKSLLDQFQGSMLDLNTNRTREMGNIDQRLAGLEGQLEAMEAAADTKFLGIF